MPFNGSGTYTLPYNWNNDAANSINITASRMQAQDQDQATALSDCVTRDGQSAWTANLPAGGFKITGLGNGSASTDSAALGQVFQIANNLSEGTAATMRTNLGLGTSATVNTGTSGATIPLLNGTNTWASAQTFSAAATFSSTLNKVTLTAPATAATLTIANNKTFTCNNTLTLSGTDSSTLNIGAGGTLGAAALLGVGTGLTSSGGNIIFASISDQRVMGNVSGSSAAPIALTKAQLLTMLGISTFTSSDQTISGFPSSTGAISHGLGVLPQVIALYFVNQISQGGYSPGDLVLANPSTSTDGNSNRGLGVLVTTSTITVQFSGGPIDLISPSTGATFAITAADWKLRILAAAFA